LTEEQLLNFENAKTLTENLEANFRDCVQPKMDIAEATNFCQLKPLQTKALTENLELNFGNLASQKADIASKRIVANQNLCEPKP
jgi:hypothetical protein